MIDQQARHRLLRRIFGAMSLALFAYAAMIAWTGHASVSGKTSHGEYFGAEALRWAGLYACIGAALLGFFLNSAAKVGAWMGTWLCLGIAVVLIPAYLGA